MGLHAHDVDTFVDTRLSRRRERRHGHGQNPASAEARNPDGAAQARRRQETVLGARSHRASVSAIAAIPGPGTWSVRVAKAGGGHWSDAFATADDYAEANGATVMDYWQAAGKARAIGHSARHGGDGGKLGTVAEAVDAYEAVAPPAGCRSRQCPPRPHVPAGNLGGEGSRDPVLCRLQALERCAGRGRPDGRPPSTEAIPDSAPPLPKPRPKTSASPMPGSGSTPWRRYPAPPRPAMWCWTRRRSAPSSLPPTTSAPSSASWSRSPPPPAPASPARPP